MPAPYRFERLADHDRRAFHCGNPFIDNWFQRMAGQQTLRDLTAVHLLLAQKSDRIVGFYSLSNSTVIASELPPISGRKLPPRMAIGAHLIGHLGVDQHYQGQGLGKVLVRDALLRAETLSHEAGSLGVIVHALEPALVPWYQRLGFQQFPAHPLHLLLTMRAIRATLSPE